MVRGDENIVLLRLSQLDRHPMAIDQGFLGLWSDLLDQAKLSAGGAVVAVSVAATGDLRNHAGDVFRRWTAHRTDLLRTAGLAEDAALDFATCSFPLAKAPSS